VNAVTKLHAMAGKRRTVPWAVVGLGSLALAAGVVYWWRGGGREQVLLALQPDFRVTQIDQQKKTMIVARVQETLLVSCDNWCDMFIVGKSYPMLDRGGVLEFRKKRQRIELPVLQEHVEFEMPPGGHG
jgi:hypothetical protein